MLAVVASGSASEKALIGAGPTGGEEAEARKALVGEPGRAHRARVPKSAAGGRSITEGARWSADRRGRWQVRPFWPIRLNALRSTILAPELEPGLRVRLGDAGQACAQLF